jgi:SAM-dependent methyltransferase
MDRAEMKALIAHGVPDTVGVWADLGAGTGNFTLALAELLASGSIIYAVDRDPVASSGLPARHGNDVEIRLVTVDITKQLPLPPLDGIVMANVLHWVKPQVELLRGCRKVLAPGGRLIVVEYDTKRRVPWIPVPVPPARFDALARAAGFAPPTLSGTRRSPSNRTTMYAAVTERIDGDQAATHH